MENELREQFRPFGVRARVRPVRISHLTAVGEGIQLDLEPHDPCGWEWWGDFESDIEVNRRARLSSAWRDELQPDDVARWLRNTADAYLERLRSSLTR